MGRCSVLFLAIDADDYLPFPLQLYDQEQKINSRKCLLPKQSNSQSSLATQEEMVISESFDIYLCDNCDAELYSYGALVVSRLDILFFTVLPFDSDQMRLGRTGTPIIAQ